jgi:hypothetical protein
MTAGRKTSGTMTKPLKTVAVLLTGATIALLGGCGNDGIELNGKLFDALGVSDAAQKSSKREPKMTERTGLVVPPDVNRLPEPGSGGAGAPDVAAQLNDPERIKAANAAERARQHKLYCSGELNWKERVASRDAASAAPTSPYGPCGVLGDALKQ